MTIVAGAPLGSTTSPPRCGAAVRAAWLRFPSFELELLEQVYHRVDEHTYRYESAGGSFVAMIQTDASGFVTEYPGFWSAEAAQ